MSGEMRKELEQFNLEPAVARIAGSAAVLFGRRTGVRQPNVRLMQPAKT
jgi:hypothetical protein